MIYRKLGRTNIKLPVITLGGNVFGAFLSESESIFLINRALEHGVNSIDSADVYSDGESERIIGKALGNRRHSFFIATKVGNKSCEKPYGLAKKINIKSKLEGSLKRLQTDYIDLYQIHHFDPVTPVEEMMDAFNELITEGKVRYAGFSNFNNKRLLEVEPYLNHNFVSDQINCNILNTELLDSLTNLSQRNNISILAYGVMARGVFSGKYNDGTIPKDSRATSSESIRQDIQKNIIDRISMISEFAEESHIALSHAVIALTLLHSNISSLVVGFKNIEQFMDIVLGTDVILDLNRVEHLKHRLKSLPPISSNHFGMNNLY